MWKAYSAFVIRLFIFALLLFTSIATFCRTIRSSRHTSVSIVRIPSDWIAPDAIMDENGVLHMVFAKDGNAYYVQSKNDGAKWSHPVQINTVSNVEYRMGERGPKMAIGADGVIHVVWEDYWSPGVKTYVRYARSSNCGGSFEKEQTLSSMSGVDGVSVASDKQGNVWAFWHVLDPPQSDAPDATWLWMAHSSDNGKTFGVNQRMTASNRSLLACSMCMTYPMINGYGDLFLAYRSAVHSIRDIYVLKSVKPWTTFTALRVNHDNWLLDQCPMCGPSLTLTPAGDPLCAFMSKNRVYWSVYDHRRQAFHLHVQTPDNQDGERYPFAIQNRSGQILFTWQVGPMSTNGNATVKWALYLADGKYEGNKGTIGIGNSGTKPTAFIGKNNEFYIITSAK